MSKMITFALLGSAWVLGVFPGVSMARNDGPGTLIETRPYESDQHITATVRDMIAKDKHLKGQPIQISTRHATVTLSGSVDSKEKSNRIAAMVTRMPEVDKVRNLLKVKRR